jgi:hypothetical protein
MRLAALLCLCSGLSFAESWSGVLVDSKCYESEERNVNPTDTLMSVDRDTNSELRYCSPGAKTKFFTVVQPDGFSFRLDPAGNAKAADLIRKTGRKPRFQVVVTGELNKSRIGVSQIKVDSISER